MSFTINDYQCPDHGVFESMEKRPAPEVLPCPECEAPASKVISPVKGKVMWGRAAWVDQGPSDEPPPGKTSTEAYADSFYD